MIQGLRNLIWILKNVQQLRSAIDEASKKSSEAKSLTLHLHNDVKDLKKLIHDRTTVHADIYPSGKDANIFILIGRYSRHDYVQVYSVMNHDFEGLVNHFRDLYKQGILGHVDTVPTVKAVLDREFRL